MKNRKNRPVNGKVFRSGVYSTAILAAAILLAVLSLADGMQLRNLAAVRGMDTPEALETLYDYR